MTTSTFAASRGDEMANPDDELTRPTRRATVASAAAVSAYTLLWLVSTQVDAMRSISPFADDPWDAIATYVAIFLVFVAGSTWIRALGHRERILAAGTASRLRWGSGLAAALVLAAAGADLQAIIATGFRPDAGTAVVVLGGLVGVSVL